MLQPSPQTYRFFCVRLLMKHKYNTFLAVTAINITSIQSYYYSLLFREFLLPVLLAFSDGPILMWEGGHLTSVDTGCLGGWCTCGDGEMVVKERNVTTTRIRGWIGKIKEERKGVSNGSCKPSLCTVRFSNSTNYFVRGIIGFFLRSWFRAS